MSFRDNLQYLRASHSMTQEQLAMMLGVSRQSVTKWEAEKSYPEMDKLIKMCQIFDCTLDDLVLGDATAAEASPAAQAQMNSLRSAVGGPPQDVCGYDEHMRSFAWKVAIGVAVIVFGSAFMPAASAWDGQAGSSNVELFGLIPMLLCVGIGVGLLVSAGFQHAEFQRNHPYIQDFYTGDDRQRTQHLFVRHLVGGLCLIFIGVGICALTEGRGEAAEAMAGSAMLAIVSVAVLLIIRGSIMLGRLNIANYNNAREQALAEGDLWDGAACVDAMELKRIYTDDQIKTMFGIPDASVEQIERARVRLDRKRRKGKITGGLCGIIMIIATAAGLTMLFVPGYETPYFWLAWVFGGLCCGIASIAISAFMQD